MRDRTFIGISVTVTTDDQELATKAWDALGRLALGLALDGITVSVNITNPPNPEEYDQP